MSHAVDHVDEAQLHAYLDHELEFADPEVRKAVGRHIADCSRCSKLLKEVRLVHQQADHLMNVTRPRERPAPSFREIVERAEQRRKSAEYVTPVEPEVTETADNERFRRMPESQEQESPFIVDQIDELVADDSPTVEPQTDNESKESDGDRETIDLVSETEPQVEALEPQATDYEIEHPDEPVELAQEPTDGVALDDEPRELSQEPADDLALADEPLELSQEPADDVAHGSDDSLQVTHGSIEEDFDWMAEPEVEVLEPVVGEAAPDQTPAKEEASDDVRGDVDEPESYVEAGVDRADEPAAMMPEDDVLFIQPDHDAEPVAHDPPAVIEQVVHEEVVDEGPPDEDVVDEKPLAQRRASIRRKGSRIPMLARAAMILLAVGVGGWFARPVFMDHSVSSEPDPSEAPAEQIASTATAGNDAPSLRQDVRQEAADEAQPLVPAAAPLVDSVAPSRDTETEEFVGASSGVAAEPDAQAGLSGNVTGIVRDAGTGQAVVEALVLVAETGQATTTDTTGRFTFANVPAGSLEVGVRQIGYETVSKSLAVRENDTATADFDLRSTPVALNDVAVTGAGEPERRARAERSAVDEVAEADRSDVPRDVARSILGGPIVAIDGLPIASITRTGVSGEVRVEQTTADNTVVRITITSPGTMGDRATLEGVEVTSEEGAELAVGSARYGNYQLTIDASTSALELESLIRRITVAPEAN